MDIQIIKSLLIKKLNLQEIHITGDHNHIKIIAVGNIFKGISPVNKQKMIYTPLTKMIIQKKIHAVSIESYTPDEWHKKSIIKNDFDH